MNTNRLEWLTGTLVTPGNRTKTGYASGCFKLGTVTRLAVTLFFTLQNHSHTL